jgi:phage shock protein PspC (stress-responsive transcriptional regulator)
MPAGARFFGWIRQLGVVRGRNRWVGGVASGLAERWRIDPVIVRGLVVVLTLFFGVGLLAYGLAWALLPESDGRIHAEEVGRGRWSTGMTGATVFTLLGLIGPGRGIVIGDHVGWWPRR